MSMEALPTAQEWVQAAGLKKAGREWNGPCPVCGGDDRFHVAEKDAQTLVGCRVCIDGRPEAERAAGFREVLRAAFPDRKPVNGTAPKTRATTEPAPPPKSDGKKPHRPKPFGPADLTYEYTDADGEHVRFVYRWNETDTYRKEISQEAGIDAPTTGWPLYRLASIEASADKPILIVEGEGTAECAQHLLGDHEATTTIMGAGKAEHTDWTPAKGRRIVIWPDTDERGREHGDEIARRCIDAGATSVKLVDVDGFTPLPGKESWDLSDYRDGDDIESAVSSARPVPIRADERTRHFGTFSFMSAEDLLTASDEGVAWLVDDMLSAGGLSMLVAKPKVGKSTLARTLAVKVAQGAPWLGRAVQQGPVLYIALEEQRAVVAEHFRAMGVGAGDALSVYVGPPPANAVDALIGACKADPRPALVIVDPLFRVVQIDDGNDYAKVTAALAPLVDLARETGAHVLTVHHGRKSGGDAGDETLGSTGLLGAVDCHLSLKRTSGAERYLSTLQRVGPDMPETLLTMDSETMAISAGDTKAAKTQADLGTMIVDHLRDTRHAHTLPELAKAITRRSANVKTTLEAMVEQGRVVRSGTGKSGDPHRFEIVDDF